MGRNPNPRADARITPAVRRGRTRGTDIVVISHLDDAHIPLVQPHLSRELIVVDPHLGQLTFERGAGHNATIYAGRELTRVRSVWYRKPLTMLAPLVKAQVAEPHRRYAREAMGLHAQLLTSSFGAAKWVSSYWAIRRAENKARQLAVAERCGLLVPETIFTSDGERALAFLAAHPATIVKTICAPTTPGEPLQRILATRVHGPAGLEEELTRLRWAPAIFQRAIDAVADLRVTVVGSETFTAALDVDSVGHPGVRDWRERDGRVADERRFRAGMVLPAKVRRGCIAVTRAFGLESSSMDLVVDAAGNIWFLDLNPNGQWGFVEEETGLPIGAAFAALLEQG